MAKKKIVKEIALSEKPVEKLPETHGAAIAGLHLHFKDQSYNNAVALFEAFLQRGETSVGEAYHWVVAKKDAINARH
jgi:hypothetical protein